MFLSEAIALIEHKLCINHWKILYKLCVFYVDRNFKMTTTAGHSFCIGPIGSFYIQVNDTGSRKPLVDDKLRTQILSVGTTANVALSSFDDHIPQICLQSVSITTTVASSNLAHGEMYSIQH